MSELMNEEDSRTVRTTMKELQDLFIEKNIHPNVAFSAMISLMLSHAVAQKDPMKVVKEISEDMTSAMEDYLKGAPNAQKP